MNPVHQWLDGMTIAYVCRNCATKFDYQFYIVSLGESFNA